MGRARSAREHADQQALLSAEAAAAKASLTAERKATADRDTLQELTDERLRATFSVLSAEALRTNNQSFLDLAKASLAE